MKMRGIEMRVVGSNDDAKFGIGATRGRKARAR